MPRRRNIDPKDYNVLPILKMCITSEHLKELWKYAHQRCGRECVYFKGKDSRSIWIPKSSPEIYNDIKAKYQAFTDEDCPKIKAGQAEAALISDFEDSRRVVVVVANAKNLTTDEVKKWVKDHRGAILIQWGIGSRFGRHYVISVPLEMLEYTKSYFEKRGAKVMKCVKGCRDAVDVTPWINKYKEWKKQFKPQEDGFTYWRKHAARYHSKLYPLLERKRDLARLRKEREESRKYIETMRTAKKESRPTVPRIVEKTAETKKPKTFAHSKTFAPKKQVYKKKVKITVAPALQQPTQQPTQQQQPAQQAQGFKIDTKTALLAGGALLGAMFLMRGE